MKRKDNLERYRQMNKEQLNKELKKLDFEMIKAHTGYGVARLGKDKEKGQMGSDIIKRIRREQARIKTVLNEKLNPTEKGVKDNE